MAKEVSLKIVADASKATQEAQNLKKELREATREAQALAAAGKIDTDEYINARNRVAELKDQLRDFNEEIAALDPGKKFQTIAGAASGLAGGFQAAQGAMALFGAESKNVEAALLKVQAATALAQGIDQVREFGKMWDLAKVAIGDSAKKLLTYIGVVEGASVATNILNVATKAFTALTSPLGLILTGISAAVAYFATTVKDTKDTIVDYDAVVKENTKNLDDNKKAHEDLRKELDNSNKEALKNSGVLADATLSQVDLLDQTLTKVGEIDIAYSKSRDKLLKDFKLTQKDIDLFNAGLLKSGTSRYDNAVRFNLEEGKLFRQNEANKQLIWQTYNNQNEILQKNAYDKQKLADEKAKKEALDRQKKQNDDFDKLRLERNRQERANENQQVSNFKIVQSDYLKIQSESNEMLSQMQDFNAEENANKKQERADYEIKQEEDLAKAKAAIQQQFFEQSKNVLNAIGQINDLQKQKELQSAGDNKEKIAAIEKKYFERNKKLQIAQATIATAQSAVQAYQSLAGIPIVGPALAAVAAAAAITAGALQISKIKNTNYDGGGASSSGGGIPSAGGSNMPQTNAPGGFTSDVSGQRVTNQSGEGANQQGQFRVYVLESDITATQDGVAGIKRKAKVM
jgi:hypothetical protein